MSQHFNNHNTVPKRYRFLVVNKSNGKQVRECVTALTLPAAEKEVETPNTTLIFLECEEIVK